ncbi:triple-gene-block-protein 2 [Lettuce virus X]|uniref:Triple-gene-block-protein 2 n=1 Tax=Lettuce virus X TaxID=447171 RepID=B3CJG4_9VIRU|nr:triple-gene-block-protein 2 [Lettuce virus X]CAN88810.1 triple-gene-block-protein 2 [Lettuce virus X]
MPGLTPPPNHEHTFQIIAIGFLCCGIIYALRTNHAPHTGDQQHSLPFGGHYQDGTKRVIYNSPSYPNVRCSKLLALAAILGLSAFILGNQWYSRRSVTRIHTCVHCSNVPPSL